jgi:hypothetical protein
MAAFNQKDFTNGIQFFGSDMDIAPNGYQWIVNGRIRDNGVKPINRHEEITNLPQGELQATASLGNIIIVFIAGYAYYRLYGTTSWLKIGNFAMSTTADRYWTQVIPASTLNFKRTLASSGNLYDSIQSFPSAIVAGTPSGLIVQDNINQPWLIYINNQTNSVLARQTKRYSDWQNTSATADDREYVPIGNQMMFLNNKLYIVSRDKRAIYHSVTGRPLDFMVNIDVNGNKQTIEANGGASSVSFSFDYNEITCIIPTNLANTFLYATRSIVRLIQIDYSFTIFGEPRYKELSKITVGAVNDKSIAEILGDYIILDREAITSFNAVKQLNWEGRNSIFSKLVTTAYKGITQTNKVCVIPWNNYVLFSTQSTFGPIIAVFDTLSNQWVSFDITSAVRIKDFTILTLDDENILYVITHENQMFRMFGDDSSYEYCMLRTRGFALDEVTDQKTQNLKLTFLGAEADARCRIIEYVDEVKSEDKTLPIKRLDGGITFPVKPPVVMSNDKLVGTVTYELGRGLAGRKIHFIICWQNKAILKDIQIQTTQINKASSVKQAALVA